MTGQKSESKEFVQKRPISSVLSYYKRPNIIRPNLKCSRESLHLSSTTTKLKMGFIEETRQALPHKDKEVHYCP